MRGDKRANWSRQRSSVLVEVSLVMVPLLAILFGVLDLSIAIFVKNTVQFAVCQGVRYAVTSQTLPGMGQDDSIKSVVQGYTMGLLDQLSPDHIGNNRITITYYYPTALPPATSAGRHLS